MMKLGFILTELRLLTEDQVKTALELQKMTGKKLGDTIIDMGMLSDVDIVKALEKQINIPYANLEELTADPAALSLISEDKARKYCAVPVGFDDDRLIVVINDPLDVILIDEIGYMTGRTIVPRLSTKKQIMAAIDSWYSQKTAPVHQAAQIHKVKVSEKQPEKGGDRAAEKVAVVESKTKPPEPKTVEPRQEQKPEPKADPVAEASEPTPFPLPEAVPPSVIAEQPPERIPDVTAQAPEKHSEKKKAKMTGDDAHLEDRGGPMLDFAKTTKQLFAINMTDNQFVRVRMPNRRVFTVLLELQDRLAALTSLSTETAAELDEIYVLCAAILSNNADQKEIASDYLADMLDIEDVRILLDAYLAFVNNVLNGKSV